MQFFSQLKENHSIKWLILIEIIFLIAIIILGVHIKRNIDGKIRGIFTTTLKKEGLLIDDDSLKHFYEPKPNSIWIDDPDWLGYITSNTINSDALNERYEYSIEKPSGTFRIISLGASITFGAHIPTQANYSEILEDLLNTSLLCPSWTHFDVINLGVGAYDIDYTVQRFIKRGIKYHPDLVLWMMSDGMFKKILEYTLEVEDKMRKNGIKDHFQQIGDKVVYFVQNQAENTIRSQYDNDAIVKYQSNKLLKFSSLYSGKLLLIPFPKILDSNVENVINEVINQKQNFTLYPNNISIPKEEILKDGHPTSEGHRKIAEELLKYLHEKFFPSCKINNSP